MAQYPGNTTPQNPDDLELTAKKILLALIGGGPSGGIPVVTGGGSVTPNFVELAASGSQVIPSGAKGWTVTILTGTGTVGGKAVPAGFSDGDTNTLAASITVTTDAASTAYVRWNT